MRLIIAANRLPITVKNTATGFDYVQSSGGLVTGLKSIKAHIDFIWVGNLADTAKKDQKQIREDCKEKFNAVPVFSSPELDKLSYGGFCNKILWPLLHSFQDVAIWNEAYYKAYRQYNDMICEQICSIAKDGDVIWIHDYHLMLLPRLVRERCTKKVKISYFLHIPWPELEVFKQLPVAKEIIRGMAGSDSIGFHLHSYVANFMDSCKDLLDESDFRNDIAYSDAESVFTHSSNADSNEEVDSERSTIEYETEQAGEEKTKTGNDVIAVYKFRREEPQKKQEARKTTCTNKFARKYNGLRYAPDAICVGPRTIDIHASPIGIDPQMFRDALGKEEVKKRIEELKNTYKGKKIILGVDRTDYIKGMPQRVFAFERFLEKYGPKAVFLQVAVPSRLDNTEYSSLLDSLYVNFSKINGRNGSLSETNLVLLSKSVAFDELVALYACADVCIISSIIDGMNLVALEYIASQADNHGVLMLSKFAGVTSTLPGCVEINPWHVEEFADKINECLEMESKEIGERFEINSAAVEKFTAFRWASENVDRLK